MLSLSSSSDAPWYSRLYAEHGELLQKRGELRRAVFSAYDSAVKKACGDFGKIFGQILGAIYNNPNSFLSKQVMSKQGLGGDDCCEEKFGEYILNFIGQRAGAGKEVIKNLITYIASNSYLIYH